MLDVASARIGLLICNQELKKTDQESRRKDQVKAEETETGSHRIIFHEQGKQTLSSEFMVGEP